MKTRESSEKGFSLLEALVTLLLLSVIIIMLYELMIGSLKASLFVESRNDLEVFAQRTVNAIQTTIIQSRLILTEDPTGNGPGYRSLLMNSGAGPVMADTRLPLVDDSVNGGIKPDDSGETFVGNSLIVVRALEPVPVPYDHDDDSNTADINFLADRYRLEYYYLSERSERSFNGTGNFVDIWKTESEDFADFFQLNNLPADPQLKNVAAGLHALPGTLSAAEIRRLGIDGPITRAWNPAEPYSSAFHDFDTDGLFTDVPNPTLTLKTKSMIPELLSGRVSGKMEYSICRNNNTQIGNGRFGPWGIPDIVPLFAQLDGSIPDFPAGFEVKLVGPTGSRAVWNRLVLCSEHLKEIDSQESVIITSTREF